MTVNETILEKAKILLGDLEHQLSEKLGKEIKLQLIQETSGWWKIISQDLIDDIPQFLKPLFKSIRLEGYIAECSWGLSCRLDYQYQHTGGGSNGYEFCSINFLSSEKKAGFDEWSIRLRAQN